jgi:dinuclear metal center YbgI/SA1388 family protein
MPTPTVAEVIRALEARYPLASAQSWDAPGLACGDPAEPAARVMFAVDPVAAVLDEAIAWQADLLVTHHPLLLRGVHGVGADTYKGRIIHRAIRAGVALYSAHTNADQADPGVSDAIAVALGLREVSPLEPGVTPEMDKYQVMVPTDAVAQVIDAMAAAGAGRIGNYDRAAFIAAGTGTFRPLPGANPTIGGIGAIEEVPEAVINMIAPRAARAPVVAALLAAHPYEEPAYDVLELVGPPATSGIGRIGALPVPMTLRSFAGLVAATLPATHHGVRVAGPADLEVTRVALCGGAGDSLLAAARGAGASVYLTSDLRHHPAGEHLEAGGPALVDVSHWAAEWMWLPQAERALRADLAATGLAVATTVSRTVTDPWTDHIATPPGGTPRRTGSQEDPS